MFRPLTALLAALAGLLAGCHVHAPEQVRIAINAWPGYEYLYLAQELGYLKSEHHEVRVVEMSSLASVRRAFERGHLNGIGATLVDVAIAADAGAVEPAVIVAVDVSDGGDAIMARQGLRSMRDLAGRTVAVEAASLNLYLLARALEMAGMSFDDIEVLTVDAGAMAAALHSGRADAVVTYPPVLTELKRNEQLEMVFSSADIPGEVVDVLAIDATLAREHPDVTETIRSGFFRAFEYSLEHPEAIALMAAREGISLDEFQAALADLDMIAESRQRDWLGPEGRVRQALRQVSGTLYANGLVESPRIGGCCLPSARRAAGQRGITRQSKRRSGTLADGGGLAAK